MKSFFKKLAFVMALAMVVSLAAPAAKSALAATEFTYAEQKDGKWAGTGKVSSLAMKAGDEVDLGFVGVKEFTSARWESTNPAVASVDKKGVITALTDGVTEVVCIIDDGSVYTSTPVKVTVGAAMNVALGTSKDNTFSTTTLTIGNEIDLNFYGIPNYSTKRHKCSWISDKPEVATVDAKGVVRALASGTAKITLVVVDQTTGVNALASVVVTVEANESFTAKQTSHITFDVNFSNAVSYGRDDVRLYRVFNTDKGDVYVVWAVKKATLSNDKKTLTVEPYVQFGDAERYLVAFEDIDTQLNEGTGLNGVECYEFTTYIGEIDNIKVAYSSNVNGQAINGIAYTNGEDADEDVEVTLSYKLYSGEVDLTEIYKDAGYVEFEFLNENTISDFASLSDNILIFTKENIPAVIRAKYTFENKDGEEKTTSSPEATIVSKRLEPFSIVSVKEWSFIDNGDWSWSKPVHSLRAGKVSRIALLLVDNRGGQWETVAKDNNIPEFKSGDSDTDEMYLRFYSTDNDHFLVSDDGVEGSIETYMQMRNAVVYVALHDEKLLEDKDDDFVRNIAALVLDIQAPAKFSDVVVKKGNDIKTGTTLVTNAVVDPANDKHFVDELTKESFSLVLQDQDKKTYNPDTDPVLKGTHIEYSITTTNKALRAEMKDAPDGVYGALWLEDGELHVDAAGIKEITENSGSVTATITATQYDESGKAIVTKKTSFKVTLRNPALYTEDDSKNGKIPGAWAVDDVNPNGWGLSTNSVGLMPNKGISTSKVEIPMLSKGYTVGFYNRYDMYNADAEAGNQIFVASSVDEYVFKKNISAEDAFAKVPGIYVLVTGPDNKAVQLASGSALGTGELYTPENPASGSALGVYVSNDSDVYSIGVKVTDADEEGGVVNYLPTGKYTVKVTFVDKVTVGEDGKISAIEYKTRTSAFTVTDDIRRVKFVDRKKVETSLKPADKDDLATIRDIIQECFKFEYHKEGDRDVTKDWVPTDEQIDSVDCIVKGDYITIKSITFKIQSGDNYYVTVTRDINKAIKVGVDD